MRIGVAFGAVVVVKPGGASMTPGCSAETVTSLWSQSGVPSARESDPDIVENDTTNLPGSATVGVTVPHTG